MSASPYEHWIDSPGGAEVQTPYVLISGWVATRHGAVVSDLHLWWAGEVMPLATVDRPDVVKELNGRRRGRLSRLMDRSTGTNDVCAYGFQGLWSLSQVPDATTASVRFGLGGATQQIDVPVLVRPEAAAEFAAAKRLKAEKIAKVVQCPSCRGPLMGDRFDEFACTKCDGRFSFAEGLFDFLPADLRRRHRVAPTTNISAWGYDEKATELIERFADGLILDCGSGLRPLYLPNVVNFEVADYPTTDALGVAQALPFMDDSFDAVFSFAVLEHVEDPFAYANELVRVLKPGGVLFAVVPFLQPFHGYPDHYYNMTSSGLSNLFANHLEITESGVPDAGMPIFSLTWILNSYLSGLDAETAAAFTEMKVKDLTGDPWSYLNLDMVKKLSSAATNELAATNFVVGVKPRQDGA